MPGTPHRIRRQRVRLRLRTASAAWSARAALRDSLAPALLPAIERALDACCPTDEVLRLGRLDVRVQLASIDDLAQALPPLLERAVREQVERERARLAERGTEEAHPAPPPGGARRLAVREHRLEALARYLATGSLPWSLAGDAPETAREVLRQATAEAGAARLHGLAPPHLQERAAFYFRLLQLLPGERWREIADAVAGLEEDERSELRELLVALAAGGGARHPGLRLAAVGLSVAGIELARPLDPAEASLVAATLADAGVEAPSRLPPAAVKLLRRRLPSDPAPGPAEVAAAPVRRAAPAAARGQAASAAAALPSPGLDEPFGISVHFAGLVLLHPYLPRFLATTGVYPGAGALPAAAQARAAALLNLLATDEDDPFEPELASIKVLLGLRPETSLPVASGLIGVADREEADRLLRAAIGHWDALRSTSPAGLQRSFLVRRGLLREVEGGFRLEVEPAAHDVLLAHLPWAISVVRLPWMPLPLFTHWVAP